MTEKTGGLLPDGVICLQIYVLLDSLPSCSYHCLLLLLVLGPTFTPSKRQMWKKRDFRCFLFSLVFIFKDEPILLCARHHSRYFHMSDLNAFVYIQTQLPFLQSEYYFLYVKLLRRR